MRYTGSDTELKSLLFPELWWENRPKRCRLCGYQKPDSRHAEQSHGFGFVDFNPTGRVAGRRYGPRYSGGGFVVKKILHMRSKDMQNLPATIISSLLGSQDMLITGLTFSAFNYFDPNVQTIRIDAGYSVDLVLNPSDTVYEIDYWRDDNKIAKLVEKITDKAIWRRGGQVKVLSKSKTKLKRREH